MSFSGGVTVRESMNDKNALIMHSKLLSCHRVSTGNTLRLEA